MSELSNGEAVRQQLETYITERREWLRDAIELVTDNREAAVEDVFQRPMQDPQDARAAATPIDLNVEQEQRLREIAGRFGIGGEADVVSEAEHQIVEGGKPWKVEGEAAIAGNARSIIFAGSPNRKIGEDESSYMAGKFQAELTGASEYEMARAVAEQQAGFSGLSEDDVMSFGYEVSAEHAFSEEPTGQLAKIGEANGADVLLLRVDGETYVDEDGKEKQRFRPDSAALMGFISQVLSAGGDESSKISLNTSTTYAARVIDTMRAGLAFDRVFEVGMYGRQTLADIKGEPVASPTEIQNIPGELRIAHDKLQQLDEAIHPVVEE